MTARKEGVYRYLIKGGCVQKKGKLGIFDWFGGVLWSIFFAIIAGAAIAVVIVLFFVAIVAAILWSPFYYVKNGPKKNSHDTYLSGDKS